MKVNPRLATSAVSGLSVLPDRFGWVRTGRNCVAPGTSGSVNSSSVVCVPNAWNIDGARKDVPTEARNANESLGRHKAVSFGSVESTPPP